MHLSSMFNKRTTKQNKRLGTNLNNKETSYSK